MAINHNQICHSDYRDEICLVSVLDLHTCLLASNVTFLFCRMFGFVARRTGSATENVCHLFAEMDPEQPAVAIVNFINKVMLGPQLHR